MHDAQQCAHMQTHLTPEPCAWKRTCAYSSATTCPTTSMLALCLPHKHTSAEGQETAAATRAAEHAWSRRHGLQAAEECCTRAAAHALLHKRCSGRARPHLRTPSTQLLDGHWSGASQVQVRCRTQPGRHLSNPSHQAREGGDLRRHQHQATLDCRPLSPGGGARGWASTPTCVRACLGSCPRRGAQGQ